MLKEKKEKKVGEDFVHLELPRIGARSVTIFFMNSDTTFKLMIGGIIAVVVFWIAIALMQSGKQNSSIQLQQSNAPTQENAPQERSLMNREEKTLAEFAPIEASQAVILTTKGPITVELFRDQAPLTTINWLTLAKDGFYDGIVFHRVIEDFMAQVGDPLTKDPSKEAQWGTGGPGYSIADEFEPTLKHDAAGILSMANSGPNTGGSQFFITFEPTPWLDGKHAVFGKVTEGMDVLMKIEQGDKIESIEIR